MKFLDAFFIQCKYYFIQRILFNVYHTNIVFFLFFTYEKVENGFNGLFKIDKIARDRDSKILLSCVGHIPLFLPRAH